MLTAFLIDGFNFFHSLKPLPRSLRWFDYARFCKHNLRRDDVLHSITYFTALAYWRDEGAIERHRVFIEACKMVGVNVVEGKFKEKESRCPSCKSAFSRHEEKATDVNIALHAYRLAKKVDQIFLVTGDTDLVPAVRAIKEDYPHVTVGVLFPFRRANRELKCEADHSRKISHKTLGGFVLPPSLAKKDGTIITCPPSWT